MQFRNRFPVSLFYLVDFTEVGVYVMTIYKILMVELSRRKDRKGWLTGVSNAIQMNKSTFRLSSRENSQH